MYYNQMGGMPPYMPWYPPQPQTTAPVDPVAQISQWITGLEALKRSFKEDKKPDDEKKKKPPASEVVAMILFMTLMSPIVGPIVYHFYGLTKTLMPIVR